MPIVNAGVGFFGLAEIPVGRDRVEMAEWLQQFLASITPRETLQGFANRLSAALNRSVPIDVRNSNISGFHIAGFGEEGRPEFWYVRNVDDDRETIFGEYKVREDFQSRDAARIKPGEYWMYRNGDIRAHVIAWESFDDSLGSLLNAPDFKKFLTPEDDADWVKFKIEVIADFYKRFCRVSIIGKPVDAFLIKSKATGVTAG